MCEYVGCLAGKSCGVFEWTTAGGKSTLVHHLAQGDFPADYVTFDSITQRAAAQNNPESYLKNRSNPLIIDEAQLVPDIFQALKMVIDEQRLNSPTPITGKFLLTGSANVMALPDLTTFGPNSQWDEIYFCDFSKRDGTFDIYHIPSNLIYDHFVNKTTTMKDMQKIGKRPRMKLSEIISINNIPPYGKFKL